MGFSYSKVQCASECPYKYKLRYVDKLETIPDTRPSNALYLGTACHSGIENRSIDAAIESYRSNYTERTKEHDIEEFKLKTILEKAIKEIPEGEYEHKLLGNDGFIGFIDELVLNEDGTYTMYDFKYSNRADSYKTSGQLHVYKYYFEKLTGNKIKDMYYILIPKATRTLEESIKEELDSKEINYLKIDFDPNQVGYFFAKKNKMLKLDEEKSYPKCYTTNCRYCEYAKYCKTAGKDLSELTENAKAKISINNTKEVQLFD